MFDPEAPDAVRDAIDDVVVGRTVHLDVGAGGELGPLGAVEPGAGQEHGDDRELDVEHGAIEREIHLEGLDPTDAIGPDGDDDRARLCDALGDPFSPPFTREDVAAIEPHIEVPQLQTLGDRRDEFVIAVAIRDEDVGHARGQATGS